MRKSSVVWWDSVILSDPSHGGRLHPEPHMVRGTHGVFQRRYWVLPESAVHARAESGTPSEPAPASSSQSLARAQEIVGNAFTRLRSVFPSLSRLLPFQKIVYTNELDTMAVDPFGHLYISPDFVTREIPKIMAEQHQKRTGQKISESDLVRATVDMVQVVLLHEALHLALTHFPRFDDYKRLNRDIIGELERAGMSPHSVFNDVADLEINTLIEGLLKSMREARVVSPEANFEWAIHKLEDCDPYLPWESNYRTHARNQIEEAQSQQSKQSQSQSQSSGGQTQQSSQSSQSQSQSGGRRSRSSSGGQSQQSQQSSQSSQSQSQSSGGQSQQSSQSQSGGSQSQQSSQSQSGKATGKGNQAAQNPLGRDMLDENHELVRRTVERRAAESGMTPEEYMERERNRVTRESHAASEEAGRKAGKGSANAQRLISAIRGMRRVNWQQVLREFMSQAMGFARRWRPNIVIGRRHPSQLAVGNVLLPRGIRRDSMRILVLVDASGSIDDAMLSKFLGHMQDLAENSGADEGVRFTFVPFTSALHAEHAIDVPAEELRSRTKDIAKQLQVIGGTDVTGSLMQAVEELIVPRQRDEEGGYSGVLVLTDGETGWDGDWDAQFRQKTQGMPLRIGITENTYGQYWQAHPSLPNLSFPLPMQ
jgi:predicted metal-dependent peptidase